MTRLTLAEAQALVLRYGGKLSGSRAFGQPHAESDWDYWMAERNVKRLHRELTRLGVPWDSVFLGSISFFVFDEDGDNMVEVSYLFPRSQREHDHTDCFATPRVVARLTREGTEK